MNNPINPTTSQNTNLNGIKVTTIAAMRIIDRENKKSSFITNILTQNLKELNKRN